MEQLQTLSRKIDGAKELQSVVKTMKTLAAVSIRDYERAVESLHEYNRTIEMGLQVVMKNNPGTIAVSTLRQPHHLGAVIFGSQQGMVGQFNEQIASYAIDRLEDLAPQEEHRTILAMGERVLAALEKRGEAAKKHISIFGSLVDITSMIQEVLTEIEEWRLGRQIGQVILFHNRPTSGASYRPRMLHLLPIDPQWLRSLGEKEWRSRSLPTFTMNWDALFSSLIRQYIFVSLYRAFVESLASENASRLSSMQAAEKNIEDHLEELNGQYHRQRQTAVTGELLDLVSGFEALNEQIAHQEKT